MHDSLPPGKVGQVRITTTRGFVVAPVRVPNGVLHIPERELLQLIGAHVHIHLRLDARYQEQSQMNWWCDRRVLST